MTTDNSTVRYIVPTVCIILILLSIPFLLNIRLQKSGNGWTYGWLQTSPFQHVHRALAATLSGNHIYVIGGIDSHGEYVASVEYSTINKDGSLNPWRKTSSLIKARFYHAAVSINGYIYVLGGARGPLGSDNTPIASVEHAKILADGSLGKWQPDNYLTTPRRGTKAVVYANHIYAIGGYNGKFLRTIEHAEARPDGSLSDWVVDTHKSNIERYIHSAALFRDDLYLLGGHVHDDNKVSYGDVEMSHITTDGTLSPWNIEKTILQKPRFIASSFAINSYIYILGGHDGANRLHSVEFAPLSADGHVGQWTRTADLPSARDGAAVVVYRNNVYALGGIDDNKILNTVDMTHQAADGQLGYSN